MGKILHHAFHLCCFTAICLIMSWSTSHQQLCHGALYALLILGCQLGWQKYTHLSLSGLPAVLFIFLVGGIFGDALIVTLHCVEFTNPLGPFSLTAPEQLLIWLNAGALFHCLGLPLRHRYFVLGSLAMYLAPGIYGISALAGGLLLSQDILSLICIAMIWSLLFPLIIKIYNVLS